MSAARPAKSSRWRRLPGCLALLACLQLAGPSGGLLPGGAQAWAAPGDVTVKGSVLLQRVAFDLSYGAYLKDRFGARYVDLPGVALAGTRWVDERIGYGLELDLFRGGFDYRTLNGGTRRAEFALQQLLARMDVAPPGPWQIGLGAGLSRLARSLEGVHNRDITAANLSANEGVATGVTFSGVALLEALYVLHGPRWGMELGLRYSVSPHYIPRNDKRPALDDAQRPVDSFFNAGGLACLFTLALRY